LETTQSKITTDHVVIKRLVKQRHGFPVRIKSAFMGHSLPTIGIVYPDSADSAAFEEITWDEFFKHFDANALAFLYQEQVMEAPSHPAQVSTNFYMD
jgi:hypothetical protein